MTTREKVLTELKDILAVSDVEDEIAMQDSVLDLVETVFAEVDGSITEREQDQISEIVYDLTRSPAEIAEAIIAILSAKPVSIPEDINPFTDDIWDDLTEDEIAELTATGPNYAEFSDHHYQEGCEGGDCKEAYYGKDSIIAGDIPSKTNTFYSLLVMRFNNMGYDEVSHPLLVGKYEWDWNPFGDDSLVMFGPSEEFFDKIVRYIESEVDNEGSAWYNRDYEVCQVEGRMANPKNFEPGYAGPWALCIEAKEYDRQIDDISDIPLPADVRAEYARRRKIRRGTKPAA